MAKRIKSECGRNSFYIETKAYDKALNTCKGFFKAGQLVMPKKPRGSINLRAIDDISVHPMIAHCYGLFLGSKRHGEWKGPKALNPLLDKAVQQSPVSVPNGKAWTVPDNKGQLCDCSKAYFVPHNLRVVNKGGAVIMAGELSVNIAPVKVNTDLGYNVNYAPALSSLDCAGLYMPDINLHKGFNNVVNMARNELKRELVKSERKPLFVAYVKACNQYQLIQLPNQELPPFSICGGSIWDACEGRIARFCVMVEKRMLELFGRTMTAKEGGSIKAQWHQITKVKRAGAGNTRIMDNGGLASIGMGDTTSKLRTMGEVWKRGSGFTKAFILGEADGTKADSNKGALYFDYRNEVAKIRDQLKTRVITHSEYNERYKALKAKKAKQELILADIAKDNIRNQHKNSAAIHIMRNDSGLAPAKAPNASKRWAQDDYPHNDNEGDEGATIMLDNMKTPTTYKDGIVTNADTRKPIIMKRKKRTIKKD